MKVSEALAERRHEARKLTERAAQIHDGRAGRSNPEPTESEAAEVATIDGRLSDLSVDISALEARERDLIARSMPVEISDDPLADLQHRGIFIARGRQSRVAEALRNSGLLQRLGPDRVGGLVLAMSLRTLLDGAATPAVLLPGTLLETTSGYAGTFGRLLDLLPHLAVSGPSVLFNRLVPNPNVIGAAAAVVPQGAPKPHTTVDAVPMSANVDTVATWERVSTQLLSDAAQTVTALENLLMQATLSDKADAVAYATITTAGNFTPFAPLAGDNVLDSAAQAAAILASNGAQKICVAVNPADYVTAGTAKAATSGVYIGAPPALQGVTLVQSGTVAPGSLLGFDASGAGPAWADRQSIAVAIGLNGNDWTENCRTLLAELRGCAIVRDPRRVVFGPAVGAIARTAAAARA